MYMDGIQHEIQGVLVALLVVYRARPFFRLYYCVSVQAEEGLRVKHQEGPSSIELHC